MRPGFLCVLVLLYSLLAVCAFAHDAAAPPPPAAPAAPAAHTPTPPTPTPHTHAPTHHEHAAAPPTPPTPTPTPQAQAPPAPATPAAPAAAVPVAEHHHEKIESDVKHLNDLLRDHSEKVRQLSEELSQIKVKAASAVAPTALDALKGEVQSSLDSFSKRADQSAKQLADEVHVLEQQAQSARSSEVKFLKQLEALDGSVHRLEKNAEETKAQLRQLESAFHAFQIDVDEKLAKAAASGFNFTLDYNVMWDATVAGAHSLSQKAVDLSVHLYERAQKEIATFRAESIPSREEAEKLVREWWANAQSFYFQTAQPAAIQFYHTARQYFDDATDQLTDLLAEKAAVPKETARLIALGGLALAAGVLAFVSIVIVLQILSFLISVIFYFLCCRFCRSNKNKKNKKEKKVSAPPAPAAASSASAAKGSSSAAPPAVKKDMKTPAKNAPLNKTQAQ